MNCCPVCNDGLLENNKCTHCGYVYCQQNTNLIKQACIDLLEGVGGLDDYEYHEMATMNTRREIGVAIWVVKCIGNNPDSELSKAIRDKWNK